MFLDFFEPLVFLVEEIIFGQVDQVNNRLGCDESVGVEDFDLRRLPLSLSDPDVLVKQYFNFGQNIDFLFGLLIVGSLDLLIEIFNSVIDILEILQYQFSVDDFHISDWIN